MQDEIRRIGGGLVVSLLLATVLSAQNPPAAGPQSVTAGPAARQEKATAKPGKKAGKKPGQKPGQKRGQKTEAPPATAQEQEQRRAATHVAAAYPRTRAFLSYLERNDPAAYQAAIARSADITRRREAAALRLAREHHPELARLVTRSKRRSPRAYERAIRALIADHARLQRARQVGPAEFEAALVEWKVQSQARLLVAQLNPGNRAEIMPKIEKLLAEGEQARRREVEGQIKRLREQIQRLQQRLDQDPAETVQRQLRAIDNRTKKQTRRPGDSTKRSRK